MSLTHSSPTLAAGPPSATAETSRALPRLPAAPATALAIAVPLAIAYLIASPPAGDLAAATYRSDLFARVGFTVWDTGWYAAHGYWLPSYSLLSPAFGAWLGVRVLLALSALAASLLFVPIAERAFGRTSAARAAAATFALGVSVGMLSGRVPYDLGFAIGLGAVFALGRGHLAFMLGLAILTGLASPVAGAFLALAGLSLAIASLPASKPRADTNRIADAPTSGQPSAAVARNAIALAAAALLPVLTLSIAYPNGGYEPFAASAFWPALAGVLLFALLLPRGPLSLLVWRALRLGSGLYGLGLIAAYVLRTPMGGNAARLGPLLAAPLVVGVLWERKRAMLALLAPVLLYWQLVTPIRDLASIAGDPSVNASYYAPLLAELDRLNDEKRSAPGSWQGGDRGPTSMRARGNHAESLTGSSSAIRAKRPTIVEVPLTRAHWEAAYLAGAALPRGARIGLARGWERQLDTRYAALFYRPTLSAGAYRAWLAKNRVAYVALPDVQLDAAGRLEGALVGRGLPYLRAIWHSAHWRLYRFIG